MKNSSKKNFSEKNSKKYRKDHNSNSHSKNPNSTKKINKFSKNSYKRGNFNNLDESDKKKSNSSSLKGSVPSINSYIGDSKKDFDNHQDLPNKRNFDDWVWGKHSVFEALNSERPINRIWCTSEIFSSEKFYILLKDLKSTGVLVEEVSWNRLSQLTFGASHQGVALQLASSKTISLEK